jgi:thioredoxin 1
VPCIKLKPVIEQLEAEEKDKAIFIKINVDDNPEIATHFEINTLPLFYIYRNGKIAWQYSGIQTKKELADKIALYKY